MRAQIMPMAFRPWTSVYVCPAGHRAIVRDIETVGTAPTAGASVYWGIYSPESADQYTSFLLHGYTTTVRSMQWTGQVVLFENEHLIVRTDMTELNYLVSGAELPSWPAGNLRIKDYSGNVEDQEP